MEGTKRDGPVSVVVVDDHPEFRQGLREAVDEAADLAVVAEAPDGAGALRLVREHQPDVVLMDLQMPLMDGIGATAEIVKLDHAPPVIVLTASSDSDDVLEALAAGAAGYLLKGASPEEIHSAVRAALAGGAPLSSEVAGALMQHVRERHTGTVPIDPLPPLTDRETKILELLALGRDNKQIADELFVSTATVKTHMARLFQRLGVSSRAQAAVLAVRAGIV